jgi:hypothetical protein
LSNKKNLPLQDSDDELYVEERVQRLIIKMIKARDKEMNTLKTKVTKLKMDLKRNHDHLDVLGGSLYDVKETYSLTKRSKCG